MLIVPAEKNISFSKELQQTLQSRQLLRTELPFSDEMIEWHIKMAISPLKTLYP